MAKHTLLYIVQQVLNDLDSDEVNSIDDTIESQQVANIVRDCYEEIISNRNWPHLKKLVQFDSLADLNKPTYLKLPENVKEVVFFKYDKRTVDKDYLQSRMVEYKYPDEFLKYVEGRKETDENSMLITDFSGSQFVIKTNQAPEFWTSFDDSYIVCDAYDSTVDDTLKSAKTQVMAVVEPTWVHLDGAVPDLPSEAFSLLIAESKSTAALKIKQATDQKAEQQSKRQNQWLSRKAWRAHGGVRYDNYGRTGKK